jgi:dTDP-4-dehydrorhamnose 3,5-epimerase-like enzyme
MEVTKIVLPEVRDSRGALMFAEQGRHIPFSVKRIFAIYDVPAGVQRGGHAHRAQEQFLMMLAGACKVVIDDGTSRVEESLVRPSEAIYVPAGLWLELRDFTAGAICVVLSSGPYDEADYVRDYREYLAGR